MASSSDGFDFSRERRIQESKIRDIFTPGVPVSTTDFLFGRKTEISAVVQAARIPGIHILVFGERGIGKSSLANVSARLLDQSSSIGTFRKVITHPCHSGSTFDSIFRHFLEKLGVEPCYDPLTPSFVATAVSHHSALLVIDEFDAIIKDEEVHKTGELIKLLSDLHSKLKLMIVGIAETCSTLMRGHKSIERNVAEVRLTLIENDEIERMLVANAAKAQIAFDGPTRKRIIDFSAGFPYFAQLLALHSAEDAVAANLKFVGDANLQRGLQVAVKQAEERLQRTYREAVSERNTKMYKLLIHAAASLPGIDFTTKMWHDRINLMAKKPVTKIRWQRYMRKIVSNDRRNIIMRITAGEFKFTDLRMKSYVRMQLQAQPHSYE